MNHEPFINTQEAASFLRLSTSTIYKLASQGGIPYYKFCGRLRFKKSELISFAECYKSDPNVPTSHESFDEFFWKQIKGKKGGEK